MSKQLIDRQEKGRIIAAMNGSVKRINDANYKRINDANYKVKSQNGNDDYDICSTELGPKTVMITNSAA